MYLIALCDDEISELKKAEQMLGSYKEKYSDKDIRTDYFKSARELLEMVRNEGYMPDLLLLDIYMPDKMGIEAAKELRDMGNKSRIVFLTTSKEHALEAFGVNAVQYLVKPVSESMLFPLLDRLLEDIERERKKYLVLRVKGRVQRVPVDEIVYCEAQGKTQCLHLADDTQCMLRVTMAEIYGLLSGYPEFVRVGIAYIVNLGYIDSLNAQDISLNSGMKIHLPRGSYKTLKEQYFQYYCGRG
ncbi:DNA-binding response regulator [bacterium D16-51]|nr:DNA-binding response regulator [bacterium D16-59]RKI61728.1 DNA-binding response regulator [bacterium D16-51]